MPTLRPTALVLACAALAACHAPPRATEISVTVVGVDPGGFDHGLPSSCRIRATVTNASHADLGGLTFALGTATYQLARVPAGAHALAVVLAERRLDESDRSCVAIASDLATPTPGKVLSCAFAGFAGGDCRALAQVASAMTPNDVSAVADAETAARKDALAPLTALLDALPAGYTDADTLNAIVWADSQNWPVHKYAPGSVRNVTTLAQAEDGSWRTLRADLSYDGGEAGWVEATLYTQPYRPPCLRFWDGGDACRQLDLDAPVPPLATGEPAALRLTPAPVPEPTPAPSPSAPPPAAANATNAATF